MLNTYRPAAAGERRYRALFDTLPQMVGVVDAGGRLRHANAAWKAFTGSAVDERGLPNENLVGDSDDDAQSALIARAVETSYPVRCEMNIRAADGGFFRHEVRIVPFDDDGAAHWLITCTDLDGGRDALRGLENLAKRVAQSARSERNATSKLREKARLMTMVEQMANVSHWRLDLISNELDWSDELYKTYGLPLTYEPSVESALAFYHPDDRDYLRLNLEEAINEATPFTCEVRIIRPDGTLRYVIAYGQPECAADGSVVAVVGCVQDVTAAKTAQKDRERLSERVNLATKAAQIGIWEWNVRTGAVDWDATMFRVFGLDAAVGPATYERWAGALHPDDRPIAETELALAASTDAAFDTEFRVVWPNGEVHNIRAMAVVVRDSAGLAERIIGTNWDITEVRTLAQRLQISVEHERATAATLRETNRLMAMAEHMAKVGYWRLDAASKEFTWSEQIYRAFDVPQTFQPTLENAVAFLHPDDQAKTFAVVEDAIATGTPYSQESRLILKDGSVRYIATTGNAELRPDGTVEALFGVLTDITARKDGERERETGLMRVSLATSAAQVGIWEWNIKADRLVWDATMFALYGIGDSSQLVYGAWLAALHDDDRDRVAAEVASALTGEGAFDTEFRVIWPNGETHNIRAMAKLSFGSDGNPERLIGTNWDVTAVRSLAEQLQIEKDAATFAADHDTLTGLLNRRGLEAWIDARPQVPATILYLDIDGFKAVNDRGGHAAGDETLRAVARILKDAVRGLDACARIGGDEFVLVLLGEIARDVTLRIFARITAAVGSLHPLGPDDVTQIGMSIGIGYLDDQISSTTALREADIDLYRCKSERKQLNGQMHSSLA